jgi:antitoxin (DNA-binding transcriptional repressor) of toxin-antitoxin stability system
LYFAITPCIAPFALKDGSNLPSHSCYNPFNKAGEQMPSANIEDVEAHLSQIVDGLTPGEPLTITRNGEPIASLSRKSKQQWPCKAGSAKGTGFWMAPDFDAPLEDFKEYME